MGPGIPSYATLCELAIFRGYCGLDEIYELDGRRYAVTEEFGPNGPYFTVSPWPGKAVELNPAGRSHAA
jgi:hypothetical protein